MSERKYKAIFFDLDGTLIPMDTDEFLDGYFKRIAAFFAEKGFHDPKAAVEALVTATVSMTKEHPGQTNQERFWEVFTQLTGMEQRVFEPMMDEFYTGVYNEIGQQMEPFSKSAEVLGILQEKGLPLYLTTMPLFPRVAVVERLKWVGVDAGVFQRITTYDNSYQPKPSLDYYRQNIELAGVAPEEILMVGNHTKEDLDIMKLGCDAYLITDHLIDPDGFDLSTVKHGSFDDFIRFVRNL